MLSGGSVDRPALVDFGRMALSQVSHQFDTIRPIGRVVSFKKLSIENFCAIRGHVEMDFKTIGERFPASSIAYL